MEVWSKADVEHTPGPRAAHSCSVVHGHEMYLFGGWNGSEALNDLWVFNSQTLTWQARAVDGSIPSARNNHACVRVNEKMYIHGGHDGSKWLGDFFCLNTESWVWSAVETSGLAPCARACHTLSRVGRKLFMFGGFDGTCCFNDINVLDLDTLSWMQPTIHGSIPEPRNAHTMTVNDDDNAVYMFGGHSGNKHLKDLFKLDVVSMTWTQVTETKGQAPSGLRGHTANIVGLKILFFGGYDGRGRSNDLYIFHLDTLTWEKRHFKNCLPAGRQRHTGSIIGSKLYIIGGFDGFKWLSDMHILDVGMLDEDAIAMAAQTSLITNYRKLMNDDQYSDITFKVQDKPIHAHKCVLAAQSDHFRAMFSSGMKESRAHEIVIYEWTHSIFKLMLEYLYTGYVSSTCMEELIELLGLADHYSIKDLVRFCEIKLRHSVSDDNVCSILIAADRFQIFKLKTYCMKYLLRNFEAVMKTQGFENLGSAPQLLLEVTCASMQKNFKIQC